MNPTGSLSCREDDAEVTCLRIWSWFSGPFSLRIAFLNACFGVFVSARRSFRTTSFFMFAVNRYLVISASRPPSMRFGLLKSLFTTSSMSPLWNCSSVSVLVCFLAIASCLSKVTLRSLMNRCCSLVQKSFVLVS